MRTPTGLSELDRVLGGGLVAGSVVLLGGDPGIGKSTLLLQMLASLSQAAGLKVLYVSGEESAQQVALRARRLDLKADSLRLLTETHSERILELAGKETPRVMVIDSIQTVYTELLGSAAGSVVMVTREGTRPLLVEVQALVDQSSLANPRRVAVGLDPNRLSMLLAVLHRHGGVASYGQDVFINVVGGVRINETGADLAVALAVLSSRRN